VDNAITDIPLRLSVDRSYDHVLAVAFGHLVDEKPADEYIFFSEVAALLLSEPDGEVIGFVVDGITEFEPDDMGELWEGPRFHVPALGLRSASPGEITTAALVAYPESSLATELFRIAVNEQGSPRTEQNWRDCLEAGDLRAHFGLGYTLCELGRHREAYAHLRYYTELVPRNAWAWCWLGRACKGVGDPAEAATAYRQALELENSGSSETEAAVCLRELDEAGGASAA
jgi:tetratricopeptide (TPR) repeat protein